MISFGNRVRELRQEKGLNLADLAQAVDVAGSTLSRIELDSISPNIYTMLELAAFLEMAPLDFYRAVTGYPDLQLPEVSDPPGNVVTMDDVQQFEQFFQQKPDIAKPLLVEWLNQIYKDTLLTNSLLPPADLFQVADLDKLFSASWAFSMEMRHPGGLKSETYQAIYSQGGIILPEDAYIYLAIEVRAGDKKPLPSQTVFPLSALNMLRRAGMANQLKLSDLRRLDELLKGEGHTSLMILKAVEYEREFVPKREGRIGAKVDHITSWRNVTRYRAGYMLIYIHRWFQEIPPPSPNWLLDLRQQMIA